MRETAMQNSTLLNPTNATAAPQPTRPRAGVMQSKLLWIACAWLAVTVMSPGCNCGKSRVNTIDPGICGKDTVCEKGQEYRKGVCEVARCDADRNGDTDCCPGQFCRFDGACVDQTKECQNDIDCNADRSGRVCLVRPEVSDRKICTFPLPTNDGKCPGGYQLFNKRCIRDLPCTGTCDATDKVCNIETNACEALPQIPTTNSNCDISCGVGTIKVLTDPDSMSYHQCCAVQCKCESLPPLNIGTYGKHADGAVSSQAVIVSSFNDTFGDLVVSTFDKVSGAQKSLEFVDGVPATGTLAGDVAGPRKGIKDPGPIVGEYSSITVANDDQPRVVYYDRSQGDLRYAQKTQTGWLTHAVDTVGDVGQYANIEYLAGKLRVTYFVKEGKKTPDDGGTYTMLRYAEASSLNPRSASDWRFVDIDPFPVRPTPCGGQCSATQICVVVGGQDRCAVAASECSGSPGPGQVCATPLGASDAAIFDQKVLAATLELQEGNGLFSSLAINGADIYVAYYDNYTDNVTGSDGAYQLQTGILKAARLQMDGGGAVTGSAQIFVVDSGKQCDGSFHDVGRFASMATSSVGGRIGIAYQDAAGGSLRMFSGTSIGNWQQADCVGEDKRASTSGRFFVVDDGVDTVQSRVYMVGADASLVFDAQGKAHIAYQDQDLVKVRLASEKGVSANDYNIALKVIEGVRAYGFYVELLYDGAAAWIVNSHIGVDPEFGNPDDRVLVLPTALP